MKYIARLLGLVSLFVSLLTLIRPRTGWMSLLLWMPKLLAGSLAPVGVVIGAFSSLVGLVRRDWPVVIAGGLGTFLSARYVRVVTAPHRGFERAFGADWESRIPAYLRPRLRQRRWTPLILEDNSDVIHQQDILCGINTETGLDLLTDVWLPPVGVRRTGLAVIYIHGGAWRYGSKNMRTEAFFRHLASQGHVIMDVAYTLGPLCDIFGMVGDVRRAIDWMKKNAANYQVDPEKLVLMGGSAGGHLALLTAYTEEDPAFRPGDVGPDTSVRGVVSYYGPPDFRALHEGIQSGYGRLATNNLALSLLRGVDFQFRQWSNMPTGEELEEPLNFLAALIGGTPEEVPEAYRLISPISHVDPDCPPTLLIQNTHDFSGMMPQVQLLHERLQEVGVPVVYVELPNTEHAFDLVLPQLSPAAQAATYDTERFLALMV